MIAWLRVSPDARQRAHEAGLDRGDRLARDAAVFGALFLHRHADAHDDDADVGLGVEELLVPLESFAQVLLGGVELGEYVADRVGEAEALKPLVVDAAVGKNEPLKPGVKQVLFGDDRLDDAGFLLCHLSHLRFLHVVEEIERRRRDREGRHAHHRHAQVGHEEKAHEEIGRHALFHDHLEVERDADRREHAADEGEDAEHAGAEEIERALDELGPEVGGRARRAARS